MRKCLPAVSCLILFCCSGGNPTGETEQQLFLQSTIQTLLPDSIFIGYLADACFGPSGEILILDQAGVRIFVFTPEGQFSGTFGECGDGPGEMGNPMSIEAVGDSILVRDQVSQGYLIFHSDYQFVTKVAHWSRSSPLGYRAAGEGCFTGVRAGLVPLGDELGLFREAGLYRIGEAEAFTVLYADTVILDPSDISTLARGKEGIYTAADRSGNSFTAISTQDEYLIRTHSSAGESGEIRMVVQPVPKTEAEIQREESFMTSQLLSMGAEGISRWQALPYRPVITGLGIDEEGTLWVESGLGENPEFNLHDAATGEFLKTVEFVQPGEWNFRISPEGILAWEEDPLDGIFKVHVLTLQ